MAGLGVVVVLTVVGCGNQHDVVDVEASAAFVASASERTAGAHTGRFEAEVQSRARAGQESLGVTTRASGQYDASLHRARLDVEFEGAPGSHLGDAGFAREMQVIIDGDVFYLWGVPGHPDRWVRSTSERGREAPSASSGPGTGSMDPVAMLEYLQGASDDIAEVGRSSVRGVATTQLAGTLSIARAAGVSTSEAVEGLNGMFGDPDDQRADFVVDIDSAGLVRRLEVTFALAPPSGSIFDGELGFDLAYTIEYFDLGVETEIPLPPADQTVELSASDDCSFDAEGVFRC
jgi:hypothetical protein